MITIDKNTVLDSQLIIQIIQHFETNMLYKLKKYKRYYDGQHDITTKTVTDTSKPCNRIVTNFCSDIVANYQGYLTGIPITYKSNDDITEIREILNYNDVITSDNELLKNGLIYGVSYELNYLDEEGQQRFKALNSEECIPIYDNSINSELLYLIRYYQINTLDINSDYMVEVYSAESIKTYKCTSHWNSLQLEEETTHYYGQVPVNVFYLNTDKVSVFDKVMTLQDAYNTLLSAEVDDFEAFCDAYLVLKGCSADSTDIADMKQNRVLLLDDTSSAEYLNKSISDTQIENMLSNIEDKIHQIAKSPNFNDATFSATSGIALRYKLVGFENVASNIVSNMTKVIQHRIELICAITNLTSDEATWRDIDIVFTRNLPIDTLSLAQEINQLRGLVSQKTLLSMLPYIDDVETELEELKKESASNTSYTFGNTATDNTNGGVE